MTVMLPDPTDKTRSCSVGVTPCGGTPARLYPSGWHCANHAAADPGQNTPAALCRVCGTRLDPAAAAGHDGTPAVYDRHPGCEPGGQRLRLVKGGAVSHGGK